MSINSVKNDTIAQDSVVSAQKPIPPTISGYSVDGLDDTALDPAGGQTVLINGTGFQRGATITIDGSAVSVVSWVSANQLSFTSTAKSAGTYAIYVVNADTGTAIYLPGLIYSALPTWTTGAGSLGSYYETQAISNTVVASGDAPITYSLYSGSLPTGASLSSGGVITGTSPADTGSTTYTFTVKASDAQLQDSTRSFSLTINTDVITWSSPANASVTTSYEYSNISNVTLSASSAVGGANITYSANAVPTGLTLSGNVISGAANTVANTAVLLTATGNATTRTATRTVYFDVQQDSVTWSNPSSNTSISLDGTAYSNTLSASSAAGRSITYTANSLPTGLTLSTATISGTPTVEGTTTTLLTATADTTNRSSQRTITWTVSLGDSYWKYTTLLLNGSTPTTTFINDASLNNNQLTIAGDTKPNKFNPYQNGYYSNYFDGSTNIVGSLSSAIGTSDFTVEFWLYIISNTGLSGEGGFFQTTSSSTGLSTSEYGVSSLTMQRNSGTNTYGFSVGGTSVPFSNAGTYLNQWIHVACVRSSGTVRIYLNGVLNSTPTTATTNLTGTYIGVGGYYNGSYLCNAYITNFRITNTVVYNANFTPSTTPLTAITGTLFLGCQSNRLLNTNSGVAMTVNTGTPTIQQYNPFTTPTTAAYNTGYSAIFDGTDDYLTVATSSNMSLTGDFTVEFWIYNSSASWGSYSMVGIVGANKSRIYTDSSSILHLYNGAAGTLNWYTGVSDLALNTWHHFAFSRVGSTLKFYTNGTSRTMTTASGSVTETIDFNGTMFIGGTSAASVMAAGMISNLRVIKGTGLYSANFTPPTSALTAVANTQLLTCQDSTFKDNSTNTYVITSYNQAQPIAVSPFTMTTSNTTLTSLGSAYFDGTGDYLSWNPGSTGQFRTGDFTVECWFYSTATLTTQYLIDMRSAAASTGWLLAFGAVTSGKLSWYYNGFAVTETTASVTLNAWNHVAYSRVSGTGRLFVNGVLATTGTSDTNDYNNTNAIAYIGSRFDQNATVTSLITGYLTDVRIIKGTALYTANFLPPQTPLTAITNTQLLTLQYNSGANNNGFVDQSSFNNIITRNGNTTQGTFSPYSQTGWSTYFPSESSIYFAPQSYFDFATGSNTIEVWVFPTVAGVLYNILIANPYGVSNSLKWGLSINSDGTFGIYRDVSFYSTNTVTWGQWNHIAIVTDISGGNTNATIRFYINGTSSTLTGKNLSGWTNSGENIHFQDRGGDPYSTTYDCYMSNFRWVRDVVYTTSTITVPTSPLSPIANTKILTLNTNRFIDTSSGNLALTVDYGTPSAQAFSPFGGTTSVPTSYSNYFDGTGDYLTLPSSANFTFGTSDFTIEGWTYIVAAGDTGIFQQGTSSFPTSTSNSVALGITSGSKWQIYANNTNTNSTASYALNTWYHFALVRNSSSTKLYINGTAVITVSDSTNYTGTYFGIGSIYGTSGTNINAFISNLRVVKGTALYTGAFTSPTSPLTTTSQGATASQVSLLTCQSNTIVDNSSNYYAITANGDTKPSQFNPFGLTNTTQVSYSPSVNGGSMYFDGSGDYLITSSITLSSDFTIEFWFYGTDLSGLSELITNSNYGGTNGLEIYYSSSTRIYVAMSTTVVYSAASLVPPNTWNHIAVVRSGTTLKLYVNGVSTPTTATGSLSTSLIGSLYIATDTGGTGGRAKYMTDVKVTQAALYTSNFYPPVSPLTPTTTIGTTTYSSVLLLNGTSGGIIDYHGTNNLETVGNTQLASEDPYAGSYYSNYFTGSSSYVTVANNAVLAMTADYTIECWVYFTALGQQGIYSSIDNSADLWQGPHLEMYTNYAPRLICYSSGGSALVDLVHQTAMTTGRWYHIAAVRISNATYIYLDGVRSSTSSSDTTSYSQSGATIGQSYPGSSQNFFGYISNLRVVKGTGLYSGATFSVPTTPLTAIANTQLLTCQSNKFIDNSSNALAITASSTASVKSMNPFQQNTGKSLYFDGTGDYISAVTYSSGPLNLGSGSFTMELWAYRTGAGTGDRFLLSKQNSSEFLFRWNSSNVLQFYINSTLILSYSYTFNIGVWIHLAVVRNGSGFTLYLNGVSVATGTSSATITSSTTFPVLIGGYAGSDYFQGYLTDIRITQGIARYTTTFTPPTTTLQIK